MTRPPIYPFRRLFARFTDYLLWGVAAVFAGSIQIGNFYSPASLFFLAFCLYPLFEAFCLNKFKTTIGKQLWGVKVISINGSPVLTFAEAVKRSYLVFSVGLGCMLPIISLILPFFSLYKLIKHRTTYWDNAVGCRVEVVPTGYGSKLALLVVYCVLIFGTGQALHRTIARDLNLEGIEQKYTNIYYDEIYPILIETLSPEAVLNTDSVTEASKSLKQIQLRIQQLRDEYMQDYLTMRLRIENLPIKELRPHYLAELNLQKNRLSMLFFKESIRISLFEKTLLPLEKLTFDIQEDDHSFLSERHEHLYSTYLDQLEAFFAVQDTDRSMIAN